MNCFECGGTYIEESGTYELDDKYVGKIVVHGVTYYRCDNCEDILYSESMVQAIESERNKRIQEILSQFPVSDFISASETASILGISRQALHKNRRINHGFIYQTKICGITFYLQQSVNQYQKTGDGRFPLQLPGHSPSVEYVKDTVPMRISSSYELYPAVIKSMPPFTTGKHSGPKRYSYAN
jgi:hypothetical protein